MIFGFTLIVFGYALLYWGIHHFTVDRYSLWCLLGLAGLFKNISVPEAGKGSTFPGPVQLG